MKNKNSFLLFLCILALSVSACSSQEQENPETQKPEVQEVVRGQQVKSKTVPAFNFTLKDLNGKNVSLSDYKGKVVLLDFWATWCPPCRLSTPYLVKMQDRLKDKNFVILAISLDEDAQAVPPYVKKAEIKHTVLYANQEVTSVYNVNSIPTFFVINKEGNVVKKYEGFSPDTSRDLEQEVQSLL